MRKSSLLSFSLSALIGLICTSTPWAATELARINQSVITLEEFNKKYNENLKFFQLKQPTKAAVLDEMIKRELAIQEARKQGLHQKAEVKDRMDTVLYYALLEHNLTAEYEKISVSDEEAKAYYDRNPEIRTSHIFVAVAPNATDAEQKAALERIQRINSEHVLPGKMSFAEIAQRFSDGPAAAVGGDIDYQSKERVDPKYYDTALKLGTPGKISEIIRSRFGYHIIKLTAIRPWEEQDKAQVKRAVFDEQRSIIFEKYMGELKKQARVVDHRELLSK